MAPKNHKLGSITANSSEANNNDKRSASILKKGGIFSKLPGRKNTTNNAKRNDSYLSQGSTGSGGHLGIGGESIRERARDRELEKGRERERDRNRETRRDRSGSSAYDRNCGREDFNRSHQSMPAYNISSPSAREDGIPKNIVALPSDIPYTDDVESLMENHQAYCGSGGSVMTGHSKFDMSLPKPSCDVRMSMFSAQTEVVSNCTAANRAMKNLRGSVACTPSFHRNANTGASIRNEDRYHKTDEVGGGIFDDGYLSSVRKVNTFENGKLAASLQSIQRDEWKKESRKGRRATSDNLPKTSEIERQEEQAENIHNKNDRRSQFFHRSSSCGSERRESSGGRSSGSAIEDQVRSRSESEKSNNSQTNKRRSSAYGSLGGHSRRTSLTSTDENGEWEEHSNISPNNVTKQSDIISFSTAGENSNPAPLHDIPSFPKHVQDDFDDERTMATMATKAQALNPNKMAKAKDMTVPTGDVTIVYTDVQGSTSMWETCPSAMKEATDIHDMIMRQCYTNHSGYEITTEGDAFNLAFQHPVDALAFALQAQLKLYKADWPKGILKHPDGKDEPALKFRGFRVRFGLHHGPTTTRVHESTGRTVYSGEGVKIAKAVERMCHGGQILTTVETWKAVSGMAERYLGRPQIVDCGEHLLYETKTPNIGSGGFTTRRFCKRIMQLVPSELAFDFFAARGREDVDEENGGGYEIKDASTVTGRLFPPLISKRQLTTSFLNAPYANGRVTICFVYTVGLDDSNLCARSPNLAVLAKYLRKKLLTLNPPGYECQEDDGHWMLAFDRMASAVSFGIALKSSIDEVSGLVGEVHRSKMFKVGIVSGPFTSMGPHKTTGMADYFGPIVNRAARVASNCEPGQVCVGIPLANGDAAVSPDFGDSIDVHLWEIKKLKGLTVDFAIFSCHKK